MFSLLFSALPMGSKPQFGSKEWQFGPIGNENTVFVLHSTGKEHMIDLVVFLVFFLLF